MPLDLSTFERAPPQRVAAAAGLGVLVFATLGAAYALAKDGGLVPGGFRWLPVGLNAEWSLPAAYSGLLLLATGLLAVRAGTMRPPVRSSVALLGLGVLFTFMAFDEVLAVHERLEEAVHLAWYKLYAPVAAVAGVAWLAVVRATWPRRGVRLALIGGSACWLVSQLIETQQYDGAELVHRWTILPEEVLEMTGSLLFLLAMLMLVQTAPGLRRQAAPATTGR